MSGMKWIKQHSQRCNPESFLETTPASSSSSLLLAVGHWYTVRGWLCAPVETRGCGDSNSFNTVNDPSTDDDDDDDMSRLPECVYTLRVDLPHSICSRETGCALATTTTLARFLLMGTREGILAVWDSHQEICCFDQWQASSNNEEIRAVQGSPQRTCDGCPLVVIAATRSDIRCWNLVGYSLDYDNDHDNNIEPFLRTTIAPQPLRATFVHNSNPAPYFATSQNVTLWLQARLVGAF